MKTDNYRWNNPLEWLLEKADHWNEVELRTELKNLARLLDGDEIQDEFQPDMDRDGYFRKQHYHRTEVHVWETPETFTGDKDDCPICEREAEAENV